MLQKNSPFVYKQTEIQINVKNVSKEIVSRSSRTVILDSLSFAIPKGCLFAINGPSGSGKSTLLNILTGIDRPTSGCVSFAGQELRQMSENRLARWRGRNIGIVFQFFQLLPTLTAQENILLALELNGLYPRRQWHDRANECLSLVDLLDYAKRLPSELSGGQQQRVAIARALANDPPVLVADEPTGNLDSKTALQIFSLLEQLARYGKTVIYVTHDRDIAARATQQIDLLDGRITSPDLPFLIPSASRTWDDQSGLPVSPSSLAPTTVLSNVATLLPCGHERSAANANFCSVCGVPISSRIQCWIQERALPTIGEKI